MPNKKSASLASVAEKIGRIAADEYEGDIRNNTNAIFSKLTPREKVILLEDVINIVHIARHRTLHDNTTTDYTTSYNTEPRYHYKPLQERAIDDDEDVKKLDQIQMNAYKNKMAYMAIKVVLVGLVVYFLMDVAAASLLGTHLQFTDSLKGIFEVYKIIKDPLSK